MPPSNTLDRIARGERVRVTAVRGDDAIARRLDDLGLREGVEVEVLRRAPFGDPTVFELHGYQLCLRRSESERVEVGGTPPDPPRDATRAASPQHPRDAGSAP